jgi:hypothetical protein
MELKYIANQPSFGAAFFVLSKEGRGQSDVGLLQIVDNEPGHQNAAFRGQNTQIVVSVHGKPCFGG